MQRVHVTKSFPTSFSKEGTVPEPPYFKLNISKRFHGIKSSYKEQTPAHGFHSYGSAASVPW